MNQKRCINIDWLELYCLEDPTQYPMDADYFQLHGHHVEPREYGTRQYKQMFTIFRRNEPWIEIRREPVSGEDTGRAKGMFSVYSCHIRLHNAACYSDTAVIDLENFLFQYRYDVRRIYRLDICCDFERFDFGDLPAKVLQRYMEGKYTKINQSTIAAHGRDQWDGRHWNSVSWGNQKSMVSTKFYNKSMELATAKHDKPYIRYAWMLCGLVNDFMSLTKTKADGTTYKPDIWRVEFSIKSSARGYYKLGDKTSKDPKRDMVPHNLNLYETREQLYVAFLSLAHHYFHFKKYKPNVRKYDCEDKPLFDYTNLKNIYHIDREISARKPSNALLTLKYRLQRFRETTLDIDVRIAAQKIEEYIDRMMLHDTMTEFSRKDFQLLQVLLGLRIGSTNSYDEDRQRAQQIVDAADQLF